MEDRKIKRVYFVRHGETNDNANGRTQLPNSPLSEKGERQADFIAKRMSGIKIDQIISSDMKRAVQTAEKIGTRKGKVAEHSSLLREMLLPSETRGKDKKDPNVLKILDLYYSREDRDFKYSDEESHNELMKRADEALKFIENLSEENICVVTHGGILRAMVCVMLLGVQCSPEFYNQFSGFVKIYNTGITLCEYIMEDSPSAETSKKWRLVTFNDIYHLGEG